MEPLQSCSVSGLIDGLIEDRDQAGDFGCGRRPKYFVVDVTVFMGKDVPQPNDSFESGHTSSGVGIVSAEALQRLPQNLQLALDR